MHKEIEALVKAGELREAIEVLRSMKAEKSEAVKYVEDAEEIGRLALDLNNPDDRDEMIKFSVTFLIQFAGWDHVRFVMDFLTGLSNKPEAREFKEAVERQLSAIEMDNIDRIRE